MPDERKEWTKPLPADDIKRGVMLVQGYMAAIISAFEHRYGAQRLMNGDFPDKEETFFDSANLLSQTLLHADRWLRLEFKDGRMVEPDEFLKYTMGIALSCFKGFHTLPWVVVTSQEGTMSMEILPLEKPGAVPKKDPAAN